MKKASKLLISGLMMVSIYSCVKKKEKNYPDEPQIYYEGINNDVVHFFDSASSVGIRFRFTDGDGNLANIEGDSAIYIADYRSDTLYASYSYPMPVIPPELRSGKALEGRVTVTLTQNYFLPRFDSLHVEARKDTLVLKLYIEDEAGNKSNEIETGTIYIEE